jgi:glycosyltransferase involved in cell wall biosynthesis
LDGYDLIISSSGAEAKFIKTKTKHIAYIHAPTHYYWARYDEYIKKPGFGFFDPLARLGLRLLGGPMRKRDYNAAQGPDYLIANSSYTKQQIKKYYHREATVIHPPVDTERFKKLNKSSKVRSEFVTAGRQTPYKRIDLAVEACSKLGLPLTVLGNGPEHKRLTKTAGPEVKFVVGASDSEVADYFSKAQAFIFPGVDDFGIVAVEAMAAGTPVIAYKAGGALDYINKDTGLFFDKQNPESLAKALQDFSKHFFDSKKISAYADNFSVDVFRQKISAFISTNT